MSLIFSSTADVIVIIEDSNAHALSVYTTLHSSAIRNIHMSVK